MGGSAVGGLMVGGCFCFFVGVASECGSTWLDAVQSLLEGNGLMIGYCMWAVMLALGIIRWLVGFNCALYACVDEVQLDSSGNLCGRVGSNLQEPLLGKKATVE